MNEEQLRARIEQLQKEQAQINAVLEQATQHSRAIIGHITEANHWLTVMLDAKKAEADAKAVATQAAADAKLKEKAKRVRKIKSESQAPTPETDDLEDAA